ncbi:hypothetical protein OCC_02952 [Thermococcus litoralis DSM 5473]|uniref:Uncharacterized protein n=1 Tax=Thermococcus litoralis (strain ATCC 51850 / DSM 5473 / JCM 8560 / NS-C) TaxID=523849 RepID=H3ZQ12_THELN|nr:hypothetical protein [Thermococcus litoralis]EHR77975.1 hypothetical protein OCC_02952 [Thermococcus litoralis DSM 5473]
MASRTAFVYQDQLTFEDAFTYFKRLMHDAENRVIFSRALQEARKGLSVSLHVMDIDSLVMQYLHDKRGRVVGRRILGAFEIKYKARNTVRGSELLVNGKQFENLQWFAKVTGLDVYYIVNVGNEEFYIFNVKHVNPQLEWRGKGQSYDNYAVLRKDELIRARKDELGSILKLLLFGGGRV